MSGFVCEGESQSRKLPSPPVLRGRGAVCRDECPLTPTPLPLSTGGEGLRGQSLAAWRGAYNEKDREQQRAFSSLKPGSEMASLHV